MASQGPRTVVVPGNHDGVHLGHQALLAAAREAAGDALTTVALFFDPHPASVLSPERAPLPITTPARRAQLLVALGADEALAKRFDDALAKSSPEEFAADVLVGELRACAVVVGPDFRFGRGRSGDVALLSELGRGLGFEVHVAGPVLVAGERVSSTRVRAALADGDVESAARLLGRVHDVDGTVVEGNRRGRTLGFPTANLAPPDVVIPKDGVYAIVARRIDASERRVHRGVANLGVRPTFESGRSLEAHLFDFDGDLYGARLRIGFVARVRDEKKFDGKDALVAQIAHDVETAKVALDASAEESWQWL